MKKLYGFLIGALVGSVGVSGLAYAKSAVETIAVRYDNIKVYRDNVLCDLRDSNGTKVEPFIYNGTTYLPLRATADLAGMNVTWEGSSKSVYLWDEMTANHTNLMEVCPPYETVWMKKYLHSEGQSFEMAGNKYSDGLVSTVGNAYALFNLDGRYSTMNLTVGHIDGEPATDRCLTFIVDGQVVDEVELPEGCLPKEISVPLRHGLQLKIVATGKYWVNIGMGNITVS